MPIPMAKPVKIVLANRPRLLRELLRYVLQRAAGRFQIIEVMQRAGANGVDEMALEVNAIEVDDATWAIIHPDDRLLFESADSPLGAAHILMLAPGGEEAVALHRPAPGGAELTGPVQGDTEEPSQNEPLNGDQPPAPSPGAPTKDATFHDITLEQLFQLLSEAGVSQAR